MMQGFRCPKHGAMTTHKCVQCDAEALQQSVKNGEATVYLFEGEKRQPTDPSATTIALRAEIERRVRYEMRAEVEPEPLVDDAFSLDDSDICFEDESEIIPLTPGEDAFEHLKATLKDQIDFKFWIDLSNCIERELGRRACIKIYPMPKERAEKFMRQIIPYGRYEGRPVSYAVAKDQPHLQKLAHRPDVFQSKLRSFLMTLHAESESGD